MSDFTHVIGIDPGISGAIAVLPDQSIYDMPTAGKATRDEYMPAEMAALLRPYIKGALIVIEKQQVHPKQSSNSAFKLGAGFALWLGIAGTLGIPLRVVTPQDWKAHMLRNRSRDKGESRRLAQERWPGLVHMLNRVKDHDRAEALLIAQYGLEVLA